MHAITDFIAREAIKVPLAIEIYIHRLSVLPLANVGEVANSISIPNSVQLITVAIAPISLYDFAIIRYQLLEETIQPSIDVEGTVSKLYVLYYRDTNVYFWS